MTDLPPLFTITNDEENLEAIQRLEECMNIDSPTLKELVYVDKLSDEIQAYENKHYPIPDASKEDVLKHLMEEHSMDNSKFDELIKLSPVELGEMFSCVAATFISEN